MTAPETTAPAAERVLRKTNLGPLHDLMLTACPPDSNGIQSISVLSRKIEISNTALYKMIEKNKVRPEVAMAIVEASEGRVTLDDFHCYVYVK